MGVSERRLKERAFVWVEPKPVHAIENTLNHFLRGTLNVGVFDSKYERAVVFAGEEPVEQGSASAAQMKITGRRRSKANSYRISHKQGLSESGEKKGKEGRLSAASLV